MLSVLHGEQFSQSFRVEDHRDCLQMIVIIDILCYVGV